MNYLKRREDYLECIKEGKNINLIYRKEENVRLITEEAPFENDINFGDSLVGRLINSVMRKAKIGANITRIKSCIRRLNDTFDEIVLSSVVGDIPENDKQTLARVMSASYFRELQKAVNNYVSGEGSLDELKNVLTSTIDYIEKDKASNKMPDKNEVLRQLKEFQKFLNSLDDKEGKEKQKEGNKLKNKEKFDKVIMTYSKNFISVAKLFEIYKLLRSDRSNKIKSTQQKIQQKTTELQAAQNSGDASKIKKTQDELQKAKLELQTLTGGGKQASSGIRENFQLKKFDGFYNQIKESDSTTVKSPIMTEIGRLYTSISSRGEEESSQIMKSIIKGDSLRSTVGTMNSLKRIYDNIRIKMGLNTSPLNENVETFMSDNERSLTEGIIKLYSVTKSNQKITESEVKDKNILIRINEEIAKFNSTMLECLSKELYSEKSEVESRKEPEIKQEEVSNKIEYEKIFEADEEGEKDNKTKVSEYWNEKMDLNKYAVSEDEVEKVRIEVEKKIATKKDSIEIQGIDPIIEIVKIFNRAYKLHTTPVIQSGRSGGKVSNSVWLEYTSFGSGSRETAGSSGGPYRHNATFDKWESAVLDVIKKKEYQRIFSPETTVKIGDVIIEKAGSNLRKFMTDLLDGEELYKSDNGRTMGAQAKFLDKYFGYKEEDPKLTYTKNETENIPKSAEKVSESAPKVTLKDKNSWKKSIDNWVGKSFKITYKPLNEDQISIYCLVQEEKGDDIYILYSKTAFFIKEMIQDTKKTKPEMSSIKPIEEKSSSTGKYEIFGTKIKKSKLLKLEGAVDINCIKRSKNDKGDVDNKDGKIEKSGTVRVNIIKTEYLVDTSQKEEDKHDLIKVNESSIVKIINDKGGFKELSKDVDSNRVEIKS